MAVACASDTEDRNHLKGLRLADFERTQLHKLRLEARAVLLFTDPIALCRRIPQLLYREVHWAFGRPVDWHEDEPLIWYDHDSWLVNFWLWLQPWLYWLIHFTAVMFRGVALQPRATVQSVMYDWISWLYLILLSSFLLWILLLSSLTVRIAPKLVKQLNKLGTSFIIDDNFMTDMDEIVVEAKSELANETPAHPVYSQAIAELLLAVSALVYTRDISLFSEAEILYRSYATSDGSPLPVRPFLRSNTQQRAEIEAILTQSEEPLSHLAGQLGLQCSTVSELDSGYGGPSATLFWNKDESEDVFLILAIKGTSPFDVDEWLIDSALQKVGADGEFLPFARGHLCHVHEGFYTSLFPERESVDNEWLEKDLDDMYPARAIVTALQSKARALRECGHKKKIPLYMTGHSLGAAISSIFYSSIAASNLGPDLELRDAYVFGTPMSTDSNFLTAFQTSQKQRSSRLWRIINDRDIVTRLPPNVNLHGSCGGIGDLATASKDLNGTILDYSAIGYGVKYVPIPNRLPLGLENVEATCQLGVFHSKESGWSRWWTTSRLSPIASFLQHSPKNYKPRMQSAREAIRSHESNCH